MKFATRSFLNVVIACMVIGVIGVTAAHSANVSLRWDANDPAPEGYRVFIREGNQPYNYDASAWENNLTTCTLTGLTEGVTYHFVVRAFDGDLESADSEEVSYTPAITVPDPDPAADADGDNVTDTLDRFPSDPSEWADTDNDGIGNNQDVDDDNDGMTDDWEINYGLDPLTDDSALDADGDGLTNIDEFRADSDPTTVPTNVAPDAPIIDTAVPTSLVGLTPVLVSGAYVDTDNDDHFKSRWQISTDSDFSTLILDETSQIQLSTYMVGEVVLDTDTDYYWRVKFIDARNGSSDWSATSTFTTIPAESSEDTDINGLPDAQEVDESVDVDEDGIPDCHEDNLMSVRTVEGNAIVGVETLSERVELVAVKSLPAATIPDDSVKMEFGLIGFKLFLQNGVTTASVNIHFSTPVPRGAKLYKYITDTGWQVYENAVFAANRKCVTLVLEDGGMGDEDGIRNGVIVDPSGIAYTDSVAEATASDSTSVPTGGASSGGGGGCFISAGIFDWGASASSASTAAKAVVMLMVIILLAGGIICAAAFQEKKKQQTLLRVLGSDDQDLDDQRFRI